MWIFVYVKRAKKGNDMMTGNKSSVDHHLFPSDLQGVLDSIPAATG